MRLRLDASQVVLTTIEPRRRPELAFDAYEYTVQVRVCGSRISRKHTVQQSRQGGFPNCRVRRRLQAWDGGASQGYHKCTQED